MSKLKNYCDIYTGNSISDSDKDKYSFVEGAIPYISTKDIDLSNKTIDYCNGMYISDNIDKFKIAPKNSTLLCIEGGSAGKKIGFLKEDVCFVNKLCCFANFKGNPKFLYYYLQGDTFVSEFNLNMTGLIGGVSQSVIKNMIVTFPDDEKQNKVVDYLDKKCSKIDKVIEDNNKEIELIEEYKQSLIINTSLIGTNNDLSKSNIEWIEKVPTHWETSYLSEIATNKKQKNRGMMCDNLLSLSYGKIIRKNIESNDGLLPENFETYQIVDIGDIILRLTDLQNDKRSLRTGLVEETGIITSAYVCITPNKVMPKYLHYLLHSYDLMKVFYNMGSGVRQQLNYNELRKLKILIPPIDEQKKISDYLDKTCSKIDKVIEYRKQIIEKLEEYKKSLIYEVVTGKKEV